MAVIIGGSGGIGLSIARSFNESGCKIVLCGTDGEKLERCVKNFGHRENIRHIIFDIADISSIKKNVAAIVELFGGRYLGSFGWSAYRWSRFRHSISRGI